MYLPGKNKIIFSTNEASRYIYWHTKIYYMIKVILKECVKLKNVQINQLGGKRERERAEGNGRDIERELREEGEM